MIREQPFLLASGPWVEVRDGNLTAATIYDRHYSRNRAAIGCSRIVGPGERIVLLTPCVRGLFVWRQFDTKDESAGPEDVNCAIFRNEGAGLSSDLIRAAMLIAWDKWPGRRLYTYVNPRRVRSANPGYHFATFPPALIEPCIKAGSPEGGLVLDPFGGAGTTGLVADRLQRNALLIELNPQYIEIAKRRIAADAPLFAEVVA